MKHVTALVVLPVRSVPSAFTCQRGEGHASHEPKALKRKCQFDRFSCQSGHLEYGLE